MPREAAITYDQVAAAATALLAEGLKPTSRSIRERLGNTGSMGTINRHLQVWKETQERQAGGEASLPASVQQAIVSFVEAKAAEAKAELMAELADQRQESKDLASENERQAEEIEAQASRVEGLLKEKSTLEGRVEQLAADLAAVRQEWAQERQSAEQARTELAKTELRLDAMSRLEADLASLRQSFEQERKARVAAEQAAAVSGTQKEDLGSRLAECRTEKERLGEQLAKAQAKADKLTEGLVEARVNSHGGKAKRET